MSKISKPVRFRKLVIWAEDGCIVIDDNRPDKEDRFHILLVPEFQARLHALFLANKRETRNDERVEVEHLLDKGEKLIQLAKIQGDPQDPSAVADRIRRRSRSFQV